MQGINKIDNTLKLRKILPNDEELLFLWANNQEVRRQAVNQKEITIDEHKKWINERLNNPNTRMWILEVNGIPAGQIRWDCKGKEAILDYSIIDSYRGKGIGKELIKLSIEKLYKIWIGVSLIAIVKDNNIASCKTIIAAGFEQLNSIKPGYLRFKFKL